MTMKTLLLLRHAKSSWSDPTLADHDRPLNDRGKRDAPRMGELLRDEQLTPDLIVSSTAKRARKTAAKVAECCGYPEEIELSDTLYHGHPRQYLQYLEQVSDENNVVMVVGHNPGMEALLNLLTGQDERMPTAALARIQFDITSWREMAHSPTGELLNLWLPKELP
jgi:phosphohistidine phosphatase